MHHRSSSMSRSMGLLRLKAILALTPLLVGGCVQAATINSKDADDVLTLTAIEASKKLHPGSCVSSKLDIAKAEWAGEVEKDGWITSPNDKSMRYHPLEAPAITSLPQTALSAFTKAMIGSDCHHAIVFKRPQFIEIKTKTESYIEAHVDFSDTCGLCGFGAQGRFRKVEGAWKMTSNGIEGTWIS
jgi:hypothetical protein